MKFMEILDDETKLKDFHVINIKLPKDFPT